MNSAKHADGKIRLAGNQSGGYALSVSDDGAGFPKEFDPGKSKGLGMKIISSLVSQIPVSIFLVQIIRIKARNLPCCSR